MLHCSHLNERLEFGMESVAILSHSFINHQGRIIPCRSALVDLVRDSPRILFHFDSRSLFPC